MNLVNRHFKILFVELLSIRIEICSNDRWKYPVISTGKVTESRRNWNVVQIITNCHVIRFIILSMQIDTLMIRTLCQQLRKVCIIQCVYFTMYPESYVYWTVHHLDSWVKRDQLDVTCFIISLLNAQHVSDDNTSILRSLRLICWVISWVVLIWFDVCWCYVVVWLWWCGIRMQAG